MSHMGIHTNHNKKGQISIGILIPVILTLALFAVMVFMVVVPFQREALLDQKRKTAKQLTEATFSILVRYNSLVRSGQMSLAEAQSKAAEHIRHIRYGSSMKDYFWINDMQPVMIMHPYRGDLEGKNIENVKDPNGKRLFAEFVKKVKQEGSGYVDYIWQWKDDPDTLVPKISYVKGFKPWGWIIGTGIYIEDVSAEIDSLVRQVLFYSLLIFLLIVGLAIFVIRNTSILERERFKAWEKLVESDERNKGILKAAPNPIIVYDRKGRVTFVNRSFTDVFGWTREEILGEKVKFVPEEHLQETMSAIDRVYTGREERFESRRYTKSGDILDVYISASIFKDVSGIAIGMVVSLMDITEKKQKERELSQRVIYQKMLADLSSSAFEMEGLKEFLAKSMDVMGKAAGVTSVSLFEFNKDEKMVSRTAGWVEEGGETIIHEPEIKTADDIPEWIRMLQNKEVVMAGVRDDVPGLKEKGLIKRSGIRSLLVNPLFLKEDFYGFIFFAEARNNRRWKYVDVTALQTASQIVTRFISSKSLQAELERSKRMESLGILAGSVAHDLNNILSAIISYPEILLMKLSEDDPLVKPLKSIKGAGERAAGVVDDLLTIARGVASPKVTVNLNRIIHQYLSSMEYKSLKQVNPNVNIAFTPDENLLNVKGSLVHIRKAIMNIVVNAFEATRGQGTIKLSTRNAYLNKPLKRYTDVAEGKYAVVSISDSGHGISSQDMKMIFEPFYTKKVMGRSGTGLGLSIVWSAMQDHNGYVDVKTGKTGTTFELYFLTTDEEASDGNDQVQIHNITGNKEKILVVDDDQTQRDIASQILERLGYSVLTVGSGEEAATYLKNNSADLVILDMIMESGLSGRETYAKILESNPRQKAIVVSGYSETSDMRETLKMGAGRFIKKPYSISELGKAVREELS